ncbi:unnamed protein product [Clonostachys rosea f. rosea IK726]|uniref:Uncharacterized protein n=1 Tax=Clonostachys rosea f. rosea IK726 TaxID=1349383 RepID=A0ACA9U1E2_BIOOC|nr:unnamed protein product [Clonostachys rosea f. rosea IK726]
MMQFLGSSDQTKPDPPPKVVNIGAVNPYALTEVILGRPIDKTSPVVANIISEVLQTQYSQLFDMKHDSVLYPGLKLNSKGKEAERIRSEDMKVLNEDDFITPDLSRISKLSDLEHVGLKNPLDLKVEKAFLQGGQLNLVLHQKTLGKNLSNHALTNSLMETITPYRKHRGQWTAPNCVWGTTNELSLRIQRKRLENLAINLGMGMGMMNRASTVAPLGSTKMAQQEMDQEMVQMAQFNDPVQGAIANSWLIAAIHAVAEKEKEKKRGLRIKLYSKGGENDAHTAEIDVDYDIPVNNVTNWPVYCRSSNSLGAVWPAIAPGHHADVRRGGDPIKAMAQINDRTPHYFFTSSRSGQDLVGLVRANSVSFKTIHPMCAYTHASGDMYRGSNLVANHAYSVLGWISSPGTQQYIVLRNPWGVTEPVGMTSYSGMLDLVDRKIWPPADMLDRQGVFALEADSFKHYFACLGIAK